MVVLDLLVDVKRGFKKAHINLMVPMDLLVDAHRRLGRVAPVCAHSNM